MTVNRSHMFVTKGGCALTIGSANGCVCVTSSEYYNDWEFSSTVWEHLKRGLKRRPHSHH